MAQARRAKVWCVGNSLCVRPAVPISQEVQGRNAHLPDVVHPPPVAQEWLFLGGAGLDVDFGTFLGLTSATDSAPVAPARTAAMPSRASSSARSFSALPACPRTQCQRTRFGAKAASSSFQISTFLTGFLSAVRQPLRFQPWIHFMMPSRIYWLSVWRWTRQGRLRACKAEIAARSSMRLLVVWGSPPLSSFWRSPKARMAPQPPGPGLPEQAPSV